MEECIRVRRGRSDFGNKKVSFLESMVHQAMSVQEKFVLDPFSFCSVKENPTCIYGYDLHLIIYYIAVS